MSELLPTRYEPKSQDEAVRMAVTLHKSGLLSRAVNSPEAAFTIIVAGAELGLSAMQSLRSIHIIEGKPALSADLMVALVKKSEVCMYFQCVKTTDQIAKYQTRRHGEPQPTDLEFTMEDARRAGLAGRDPWKKYPAAMLRARAASALARMVYPDVVGGVYDPDELGAPIVDVQAVEAKARPDMTPDVDFHERNFQAGVIQATLDETTPWREAYRLRFQALDVKYGRQILLHAADEEGVRIRDVVEDDLSEDAWAVRYGKIKKRCHELWKADALIPPVDPGQPEPEHYEAFEPADEETEAEKGDR